jgi:hypothetical protein
MAAPARARQGQHSGRLAHPSGGTRLGGLARAGLEPKGRRPTRARPSRVAQDWRLAQGLSRMATVHGQSEQTTGRGKPHASFIRRDREWSNCRSALPARTASRRGSHRLHRARLVSRYWARLWSILVEAHRLAKGRALAINRRAVPMRRFEAARRLLAESDVHCFGRERLGLGRELPRLGSGGEWRLCPASGKLLPFSKRPHIGRQNIV